ncbi:MAG: ABC transporter permease [Myxococcota bacterium]
MSGFWPILRRELFALFVTPLAWVVITGFLLIQGLHFYLVVGHFAVESGLGADAGPLQMFFGQTVFLYLPLLLLCPVLTMRLFAEERRSGTIETLLTAPVSTPAVVLGKYLAVWVVYLAMWSPTLAYVALVANVATVDLAVVATSYLAVIAVGSGYLALGTMTSALTTSQLSAAMLSAVAIIASFVLGVGEYVLPEGTAQRLCAYVSVWSQMNDFSRGIVDSRRLWLNLTLVVVPLFVTVRAVEAWRQQT